MQNCHNSHIVEIDDAQHHERLKLLQKEGQGPGPEESSTQYSHLFVKFGNKISEKVEKEVEYVKVNKDEQVDQC